MTKYVEELHDHIVRSGFREGLSDHQIAWNIGKDMCWQTVRRARHRMGLGLPQGKSPNFYGRPGREPLPPLGPEPTSPVQVAKLTLGKRVTERNGGYVLDRTPVSTADMVREANRVRLRAGLDQVGPNCWRVQP